ITLGQNITVGNLSITDDNNYTIKGNTLTFDINTGTAATLAVSGGGDPIIQSAVTLNDNISISSASGSNLSITGAFTGNNHSITVAGAGNTALTGGTTTTGALIKNDGGTLTIGGSSNSSFGSVTVNKGTVLLDAGSSKTAVTSGNITVNSGGTVLLGANNQIGNTVNMVLNGGTFSTGDTVGYSETLGTLTLSANSVIDLGTGSDALVFAASNGISWTGTLTITGWVGTAGSHGGGTQGEIFFGSSAGTLTSTQLSKIDFTGFGQGALLLSNGQLVPMAAVPEAKVAFGVLLLVGGIFWQERRRIFSFFHKAPVA
ncbi:MAG: hypothetical protein ABI443_03555, partial [Chthoniobacterales bacterium]